MVQLSDELIALLDAEASERGVSRSVLIRDVLGGHLSERREQSLVAALLSGYERVPPGRPDSWGTTARISDVSGRELAQRLDHEEHAAGFEQW